ncbi:exopolyphosphatase [Alkanindiges sp. WGS2144]|uniref:Ppx/GppA phosphatase family protein n=1 Tax=Alkanindiges sp. WGS2144 TaxID=3366808 RepID=UPI0037533567
MAELSVQDELLAAIDIGSNSIHFAVARLDHGEIKKIISMSEKVQLAAGLDEQEGLSDAAQQRAFDCLCRFVECLDDIAPHRLRIVATHALRQAKNSQVFIQQAAQILPKPIEIISGREEARLIYLGVSHGMPYGGRRLVIDIGGGSTEFIIGEGFEPIHTESLQMGCVSYTSAFFRDGVINSTAFDQAVAAAKKEIRTIAAAYKATGWDTVVGSSGTIKACQQILIALGLSDAQEYILFSGLQALKQHLLTLIHVDQIDFKELKQDRRGVLPAGLAILWAIFEVFGLDKLAYADSALREGVMYDLLGRLCDEDVRDRSVQAMMARYHVDHQQAERVVDTASQLFAQVCQPLALSAEYADLLRRAAYLHEIGLAVSHAGYHRHGAYLLQHSDIPGFSQTDQGRLALLVGCHRRKLKAEQKEAVLKAGDLSLCHVSLLLRLAVLVHHGRSEQPPPVLRLDVVNDHTWQLTIDDTTQANLLLLADLQEEQQQFGHWGMGLQVHALSVQKAYVQEA